VSGFFWVVAYLYDLGFLMVRVSAKLKLHAKGNYSQKEGEEWSQDGTSCEVAITGHCGSEVALSCSPWSLETQAHKASVTTMALLGFDW
jgi:hypothetical protein